MVIQVLAYWSPSPQRLGGHCGLFGIIISMFILLLKSRLYFVLYFYLNLDLISCVFSDLYELMNGKALRKHSLHEKTAASVLLKLFISGNE